MIEIGVGMAIVATVFAVVRAWRMRGEPAPGGIGAHILVPVARPSTAITLSQVAAALAGADRGRVTPLTVIPTDATEGDRERAEETVRRCEVAMIDEGLDARGRVRVDATVTDGILHGAVEYDASLLLLGWPAPGDTERFGAPLDALVARSRVPILLARLDGYRWRRIVLRVPQEPTDEHLRASLRLATETAERLGRRFDLEVACISATTPIREVASQLVIAPLAPRADTTRTALAAATPGSDVIFALADHAHQTRAATTVGASERGDSLDGPVGRDVRHLAPGAAS